jgi:hypothetical protein
MSDNYVEGEQTCDIAATQATLNTGLRNDVMMLYNILSRSVQLLFIYFL